jgi:carboxyl-terminal processing protease
VTIYCEAGWRIEGPKDWRDVGWISRTMLTALLFTSILLQGSRAGAASLSDRVVAAIDQHYLYADSDSWKALRPSLLAERSASAASLDKQLMQLHDGDLRILTASQMAMMQAETAGDERGIGLVDFAVTIHPDTHRPQVVTPLVDSPAFKAGLLAGDTILSVNGKSTQNLVHEDVMTLLRTDSGTVNLTVFRGGRERSIKVAGSTWKEAAVVSRDVVTAKGHLGYVAVRLFTPDSGDQVRKAVESFVARGVDRCILDLRNNPGGYLDAMAEAGSTFTDQVLGWTVSRDGTRQPIHSSSAQQKRVRLAILVNEATASAAEILAEGLRETIEATLIGSETFGRGQIQTYVDLDGDAGIVIPMARVQSPKGVQMNKRVGLKPDIEATSNLKSGANDVASVRAVELLMRD